MAFGDIGKGPNDVINMPVPLPGDPTWGQIDNIGRAQTNSNVGQGTNAGTTAGSNPGVAGSTGSLPGVKPTASNWNDPLLVYKPHGHGFGTGPTRDSGEMDYARRHPDQPWAQHVNTFNVVGGRLEPLSVTRDTNGNATNITAGPAAQRQQSIAASANYHPGNRYVPQTFPGFKTSNNPTGGTQQRTQPAPTSTLTNNVITHAFGNVGRALGGLFGNRSQPTVTPSVSNQFPQGVVQGPQFPSAGKLAQVNKIGM